MRLEGKKNSAMDFWFLEYDLLDYVERRIPSEVPVRNFNSTVALELFISEAQILNQTLKLKTQGPKSEFTIGNLNSEVEGLKFKL